MYIFIVSGNNMDIIWPEGILINKQYLKMEINQIDNIDIPQFTAKLDQPFTDITPEWEKDTLHAMEWIGLININAGRLRSSSNNFISTYQSSFEADKSLFGTIITWVGFIPVSFIMNTVINIR